MELWEECRDPFTQQCAQFPSFKKSPLWPVFKSEGLLGWKVTIDAVTEGFFILFFSYRTTGQNQSNLKKTIS